MFENLVKYNENNQELMSKDREKRVQPCGKSVCWKESASAAALLPQMGEGNVWERVEIGISRVFKDICIADWLDF